MQLAVRIKFDNTHNVVQPTFVLATRSGEKLGAIPATHISVSDSFNSSFELEFQVYREENGKPYALWDKLTDFKLIWCREWDVWFEAYVTIQDQSNTVKTVTCTSLGEAELSQVNLYNVEINTEDDIARDDYVATVLYNSEEPEGSLLHRILEKAPHYSIAHVDSSIAHMQRTFSFDSVSIYDALQTVAEEIDCIFIIDSGTADDGSISRSIGVYDLESYCTDCGERGAFTDTCSACGSENVLSGYGEDTTIFVSTENLADDITLTTDTGSVKNCFRLVGGDDLMTATIRNCNPNGSQYIWYISDELKDDMSEALVEKLDAYDELYAYYQDEHVLSVDEDVLAQYNALVEKYYEYNGSLRTISGAIVGYPAIMDAYYDTIDLYLFLHDELMPSVELSSTTAALQAAKLGTASISPVAVQDLDKCSAATASSAVLSVAKTIVDSRYQVKINDSSYSDYVWTGNITVTNYSDETDTATSGTFSVVINDDYETFVRQKISKVLQSADEDDDSDANDITELFGLTLDSFQTKIKQYCLVSLETFYDACQSCLDLLIEQGIADNETWAAQSPDLYKDLYLDYYNKLAALASEMETRESEIGIVTGVYDADGNVTSDGMQSILEAERNAIQEALDFEQYLGTSLWLEFIAYRREDTYENSNYISDGLDNGALFQNALEFIEVAKKEIYKSATLQHSLSASLKNLLTMKEFEPIIDMFSVGNWIRIKIDEVVYRLRLISYSIDFDDLSSISVEFSDVTKCVDGVTDTKDILDQATAMATSYNTVMRQSSNGEKGKSQLDDWVTNGLALTKMKIIDSADNQNITWDSHGLLCREYLPITDEYSDKQLKIINRGLYLTDDNWLTSKAGIGDFTYYNPETGKNEEAYGVIADTLVGNLILGKKVGVYNTTNSIAMDEYGLTITADATEAGGNNIVLTVQKKTLDADDNEMLTPLLYLDSDGDLVMTGSLLIQSATDSDVGTLDDLCDAGRLTGQIATIVHSESEAIYESIDTRYSDIIDDITAQLESYKADIGQYMQFNDDGLTLGAVSSEFKTLIDNQGMYFKQGDTTAAYVNNNMLYIPNAVIQNTLMLGDFFFSPRADGGVSLTCMSS